MKRPIGVLVSLLLSACGGATASGADEPSSTLNIPESAWVRTEIPEVSVSLELPGDAARQVSTRDDGQTIEYIVNRMPIAVIVAVERFTSVVTPDREAQGLDGVAQLFATRAAAPERGCTNGHVESVTHAGHAGRMLLSSDCTGLAGGAIATAVFFHGSRLVSLVVLSQGVPAGTVAALMRRTQESIVFGEPQSWFLPVDTAVSPPNAPGVTFSMPGPPATEVVEAEAQTTSRYTCEPVLGLAVVVSVTSPAALSGEAYCAALMSGSSLELTERRDHAGPGELPYCEVRGRRAGGDRLLEIHDVFVVSGVVLEISGSDHSCLASCRAAKPSSQPCARPSTAAEPNRAERSPSFSESDARTTIVRSIPAVQEGERCRIESRVP